MGWESETFRKYCLDPRVDQIFNEVKARNGDIRDLYNQLIEEGYGAEASEILVTLFRAIVDELRKPKTVH